MGRRVIISDHQTAASTPRGDAPLSKTLVSVALDDSWSTLDQEVALIDRLFGGEIAGLFERNGNGGKRHIRG